MGVGMAKEALRDEIFCQIIKQTTANHSAKRYFENIFIHPSSFYFSESCKRGWELMQICVTFFPPSAKLDPYLRKHIKIASSDRGKDYTETAVECSVFLRKTKESPRTLPPGINEITAIEVTILFLKHVTSRFASRTNLRYTSKYISPKKPAKLFWSIRIRVPAKY